MEVCILGCGPSGLVAAHTAITAGARVTIMASNGKSSLYGCQYLHGPIPGISVRSAEISYRLRGSVKDYRTKVYGPNWHGRVSPEDYEGNHMAWDIRQAYDELWAMYCRQVKRVHVTPDNARSLSAMFDLVISSIPAYALCAKSHHFGSRVIWADGSAPWKTEKLDLNDNTVLCDGRPETSWYRASRVFGWSTIEWASVTKEGTPVRKPLGTDCDCHPEILRVGRYGAWDKSKLVHQVVDDVEGALS